MAVLTKTHRALVDGHKALEINQVIVDDTCEPAQMPEDLWLPDRQPSNSELVVGAITDVITRPWEMVDQVRAATNQVTSVGKAVAAMNTAMMTAVIVPIVVSGSN